MLPVAVGLAPGRTSPSHPPDHHGHRHSFWSPPASRDRAEQTVPEQFGRVGRGGRGIVGGAVCIGGGHPVGHRGGDIAIGIIHPALGAGDSAHRAAQSDGAYSVRQGTLVPHVGPVAREKDTVTPITVRETIASDT